MPLAPKDNLKKYFETGDQPTAGQFATLIDSMVNILDDRYLLGLRVYDPLKLYLVGDTTIFGSILYKCTTDTTGAFNPLSWAPITALGSVVYISTWDAIANNPPLQSSVGVQGNYYVVQNASSNPSDNTMLDGIDDWGISDWVIFNGSVWQKVDNSTAPVEAKNVIFEPVPGITSTNVQNAIKECTNLIDKKQDQLTLKPNYLPFANTIHTLSESCISNEANGIAIDHGKVFRGFISGFGQIDFGQDGRSVRLATDGGAFTQSFLQLIPNQVLLRNPSYGLVAISSGSDNKGDIEVRTGLDNGLSANTAAVTLINTQGSGASLALLSSGDVQLAANNFIADVTINVPQLNADTVPYIDGSNNIVSSTTTSTELGYLSGVTSSIQGQLDGKQAALGFTPVSNTTTVNGHALNADVTVLASEVPQDSSNRFVTDAQIAAWNAKQNAITTGTTAQYFRGDLSLATLDSAAVGLGNVPNVDATNPTNISQDSSHRFVTDTEKTTWNGKQNAITTGTTAQYFRGDLSLATLDSAAVGLGNVPNVNATNPTNISQDSSHRFVTDTEKTTWNGKQNAITTGTTAQYFRGDLSLATLNSAAVGLGNVPNVDATNPTNIVQDSTHRFVTDAEKTTWNGKQNAITTGTTAQYFRGDLSLATLNSTAVGLGNVPNVNATNPANITQDSTHRFATDAEKTTWNGKQNAITTGTTAQYFRGDLSLATLNSAAVGLGNVTNDQQLSQKVSSDSGTTLYSSTSSVFAPVVAGNTITVPVGLPDSSYMLEWYYELGITNAGAGVGSRVTFNGTIISMHAQQPGIATNNPPTSPNDYFTSACGFLRTGVLTAGTSYPLIFELNKISGNGTVYMRRLRYTLTKI